ncbi:MAG TPA: DNA polymerase III subunit delta' [Helicobacteraceae bacterium]|nr:DNA polymerase III subunit delta' [Helicobacteraceae bacterium]
MQTNELIKSHILINEAVEETAQQLVTQLQPFRSVLFIKEDFLIEDAKAVVAEAYIAESQLKYIILGGTSMNVVSQNSLLKVLEEPPLNVAFIIIVPSKSMLLPTVRSRLPIVSQKVQPERIDLNISLKKFDLDQLFNFVKANERLKKHEAKRLIESIFYHATTNEQMTLNEQQLACFDKAYRLIELNGRFQVILVNLLMAFIVEAPRAY